jgi:glycerol transport system ATP-binding protein
MASITLDKLAHSYLPKPADDADFALKEIDYHVGRRRSLCPAWRLGLRQDHPAQHHFRPARSFQGAYLLRWSGCHPLAATTERNIAQVFQFPVIYDTMTVRQNLAFPLINRGVPAG